MNQDDFKKLLEEALEPIKVTQKEHTETLRGHTVILKSHTETLKSHTETLKTLESSVITMENTLNGYGDMYKINDDNSRKLEKRIETLEENSDIEPPPELTLLKVQ